MCCSKIFQLFIGVVFLSGCGENEPSNNVNNRTKRASSLNVPDNDKKNSAETQDQVAAPSQPQRQTVAPNQPQRQAVVPSQPPVQGNIAERNINPESLKNVFANAQTLMGDDDFNSWSQYYHLRSSYELEPKTIYYIAKKKDVQLIIDSDIYGAQQRQSFPLELLDAKKNEAFNLKLEKIDQYNNFKLKELKGLIQSKGLTLKSMQTAAVLVKRKNSFGYSIIGRQTQKLDEFTNNNQGFSHRCDQSDGEKNICRLSDINNNSSVLIPSGIKLNSRDQQTTEFYQYDFKNQLDEAGDIKSEAQNVQNDLIDFLTINQSGYQFFSTTDIYNFEMKYKSEDLVKPVYFHYHGLLPDNSNSAAITDSIEASSYITLEETRLSIKQLRELNFVDKNSLGINQYVKDFLKYIKYDVAMHIVKCGKQSRQITTSQKEINNQKVQTETLTVKASCNIVFFPARYRPIIIDTSQPEHVRQVTIFKGKERLGSYFPTRPEEQ